MGPRQFALNRGCVGARTLRADERGSIEPGKVAGLAVMYRIWRYGPFADLWFGFVRAGHAGDIRDVIVAGEITLRLRVTPIMGKYDTIV